MEKKKKNKRNEVIRLLSKQKIRDVKDIESYKLSVCHPHSAGIDLGSREIYVALNPEIAAEMHIPVVHVFNTFTSGLLACRELLVSCGVTDVAMESTSVYWTTIFSILEEAGMKICLVNPKKFRMVPGRKTDILDCQWLQTLHLYGLLRGSFHPEEKIAHLRSYMRERDHIIKDRSRYIQRMQKALVKMNLLLVNVVDDITGKTGISIIRAILQGERAPGKLASLRDSRCKKSEEEIAESLKGYYKEDQLYLLKLNYETFMFFDERLIQIDTQITTLLNLFPLKKKESENCPASTKSKYPQKGKNDLRTKQNLREILYQMTGTDLTAITGLQANSVIQIISEVGLDMSKFPSAEHFASYLGFVPHNKITGGCIISSRTDRVKSPAAQAFKKVVPSISQGKTALGEFYRRIAPKRGKGKAIVAVCRKLAIIFYNTLTNGTTYIEYGQEQYRARQEQREKALLMKLAKKHNVMLQT
jgi:transposase